MNQLNKTYSTNYINSKNQNNLKILMNIDKISEKNKTSIINQKDFFIA